jgi:hypothetical protein
MSWLMIAFLVWLVANTLLVGWLWHCLAEERVANIALRAERHQTYGRGYEDGYKASVGMSEAAVSIKNAWRRERDGREATQFLAQRLREVRAQLECVKRGGAP